MGVGGGSGFPRNVIPAKGEAREPGTISRPARQGNRVAAWCGHPSFGSAVRTRPFHGPRLGGRGDRLWCGAVCGPLERHLRARLGSRGDVSGGGFLARRHLFALLLLTEARRAVPSRSPSRPPMAWYPIGWTGGGAGRNSAAPSGAQQNRAVRQRPGISSPINRAASYPAWGGAGPAAGSGGRAGSGSAARRAAAPARSGRRRARR